eukprot:3075004-Prymnesium_polylepis.1
MFTHTPLLVMYGTEYEQIQTGRLLLLAALAAQNIPIELRAIIVETWSLREFRCLQRRRRSGLEFRRWYYGAYYGPGY